MRALSRTWAGDLVRPCTDMQAAAHEAGHAVSYVLLGVRFAWAEITPGRGDRPACGRVVLDSDEHRQRVWRASLEKTVDEAWLVGIAAGEVAQAVLAGPTAAGARCLDERCYDADTDREPCDWCAAMELARHSRAGEDEDAIMAPNYNPFDSILREMEAARAKAERLVHEHLSSYDAVARALLAPPQHLSAEAIARLVRPHH
jgi:hypothetical protein